MGGNKFDLNQWNEDFFVRLRNFIKIAAEKDIIVEVCFFNAQYEDCWPLCPLYYKNNIQGIGNCGFNDAQTIDNSELLSREVEYVAKIVKEVNSFDNVILEIWDEPLINETPLEKAGKWINYMINVVVDTEKDLPRKHLVAQQITGPVNGACDFSDDPRISILTCQYAYWALGQQMGGLMGLDLKYQLNKPIELNETYYYPLWYIGDSIADSRVEALEFMVGGGSSFNQLNGKYTNDNPSGNTPDNQKVCLSLQALKNFIYSFDFAKMSPDKSFVLHGIPEGAYYRGMSWKKNQYALYIHHSVFTKDFDAYIVTAGNYNHELTLNLPKGKYIADWVDPSTGNVLQTIQVNSNSGRQILKTPVYSIDIALRIKKY